MKYFRIFANDIAIDLGTANTLVHIAKKGTVMKEPTLVAIETGTGQVIAFGEEAYEMYGKSPENVIVVKPLENGAISDFDITKILIDHCLNVSQPGVSIVPPRALITAHAGVTDIELRAIEDACIQSGIREVYIIESSLSAAIGAGMNVHKANGHFVVDFGAGSTEMAIVSMNGIVSSKTLRFGGDFFNKKIIDYIYEKYSVIIGEKTAEELKKTIGRVGIITQNDSMEIGGIDALKGIPTTLIVYSADVDKSIRSHIEIIIDNIRYILEKNPPDLSKDIIRNGIYITGGGSLLKGLPELIESNTNIKVVQSNTPYDDTVRGAGRIIENLKSYKIIGNMK